MSDDPVVVRTLGSCSVDGRPVGHARALELVVALATVRGNAPRDWLQSMLFEGYPAPSSLPTLALRARKLGLNVEYDTDQGMYHLRSRVRCDVVEVLDLLRLDRLEDALAAYRGPFLHRSRGPFALYMREHVEQRIVRAVLDRGDVRLMEQADRLIKHPELGEALTRQGGDGMSAHLSRSWLATLME
jgi:hypothetical protein